MGITPVYCIRKYQFSCTNYKLTSQIGIQSTLSEKTKFERLAFGIYWLWYTSCKCVGIRNQEIFQKNYKKNYKKNYSVVSALVKLNLYAWLFGSGNLSSHYSWLLSSKSHVFPKQIALLCQCSWVLALSFSWANFTDQNTVHLKWKN